MVCTLSGVTSVSRQHPSRMTPAMERQFATITSRLKGKKMGATRRRESMSGSV